MNVRTVVRDLNLVNADDRKWKLNQLLFADDTPLVVDSEEKFCYLLEEFRSVCRIGIRVK